MPMDTHERIIYELQFQNHPPLFDIHEKIIARNCGNDNFRQ